MAAPRRERASRDRLALPRRRRTACLQVRRTHRASVRALEEALQRHRTEARRLRSRIRPGIASPLALAEAVEDCFRGDHLPRAELLLGSRDRLVQALEIGVV